MRVVVAEYATACGLEPPILHEGLAMMSVLSKDFVESGCTVSYLTHGLRIPWGTPVECDGDSFEQRLRVQCRNADAAIVIAPDELLYPLTRAVEEECLNLGCPSECVRTCADKLSVLEHLRGSVPTCELWDGGGAWVSKPRFGCASEDVVMGWGDAHVAGDKWEYIEGESVSMGVVGSSRGVLTSPLTLQRMCYSCDGVHSFSIDEVIGTAKSGMVRMDYWGSVVPHPSPMEEEVVRTVRRAYELLGCEGYVGMDLVLSDEPYVVDVNPRPTTSILGLDVVCTPPVGKLILQAKLPEIFGGLPDSIRVEGRVAFSKHDLPSILKEWTL
ncbi:MAG: ATP-grasp domain-containing protein [Methermicoccaceae archaeon]